MEVRDRAQTEADGIAAHADVSKMAALFVTESPRTRRSDDIRRRDASECRSENESERMSAKDDGFVIHARRRAQEIRSERRKRTLG